MSDAMHPASSLTVGLRPEDSLVAALHDAWGRFAAFEVLADHVPLTGFRLVMQLRVAPLVVEALLESRAGRQDLLDPDLAIRTVRAGLSLAQHPFATFAYATTDEAAILIRSDACRDGMSSLAVHDALLSAYASRMTLLLGREVAAVGRIFEFPELSVAQRAFGTLLEQVEDATPLRTATRLGVQLRGRGEPFHPSMLESLEEQAALLQSNGVELDALPGWWWRGVAAQRAPSGAVAIHDELPGGGDFAAMVGDPAA
jgi:hypothetical protein